MFMKAVASCMEPRKQIQESLGMYQGVDEFGQGTEPWPLLWEKGSSKKWSMLYVQMRKGTVEREMKVG